MNRITSACNGLLTCKTTVFEMKTLLILQDDNFSVADIENNKPCRLKNLDKSNYQKSYYEFAASELVS